MSHTKIEPNSKIIRWFFFLAGITATIAYRIIFLLNAYWIEVAWYVGTIGFLIYFWHRASIEAKRAKLVVDFELIEALEKSGIPEEKKSALLYLTKTSLTSKARFNSAFIAIVSGLVLVINLAMDILARVN